MNKGNPSWTTLSAFEPTHLVGEPLDEDGHQQVEQHIVAKGHEGNKVKGGPVRGPLHSSKKHNVPVFLCQHLPANNVHVFWSKTLHLEHCHGRPQQGVKVFSVADFCLWVAELAAKKVHAEDGEDEDEQHEETEEDGNIVHCAKHHDQLSAEIWEKTNKLENS